MVKSASMLGLLTVVLLLGGTAVQGRQQQDMRFIAAVLDTRTILSLTTVRNIVPRSCFVAISSDNICRKRKKKYINFLAQMRSFPTTILDGSLEAIENEPADGSPTNVVRVEKDVRSPRLAITLWSTVYSPFTYTSTSTNNALTFSLSFQCTFPGQYFPLPCGGNEPTTVTTSGTG